MKTGFTKTYNITTNLFRDHSGKKKPTTSKNK